MAFPPTYQADSSLYKPYADAYARQDQQIDALYEDFRGVKTQHDSGEYSYKGPGVRNGSSEYLSRELEEIDRTFQTRKKWIQAISCCLIPITWTVKKLCCEPCCPPCFKEPTETKTNLLWHACNPDTYFDLDFEVSRELEGYPSAEEVCLLASERERKKELLDQMPKERAKRELAVYTERLKTLDTIKETT